MSNVPHVLVIAESANPEWVSVPLVGWSLATALREVANVHIVTQVRNREAFIRAGMIEGRDFTSIDSEKAARPLYRIGEAIRGGKGVGWTTGTAVAAFSYYYFEHLVWKSFGDEIRNGSWDIVHRITPLSPTIPSLLAKKCARARVPFVLGPLNGGVPWPKDFDAARRKEKEWLSYIRGAHKLMPGYTATRDAATALLIGSQDTLSQVPAKYRHKCIYIPENGIDPARFSLKAETQYGGVLRACFVGRLVPYKGPDMLIEAAVPLLKARRLHIDVIGDGPLMARLREIVDQEGLDDSVSLHGWVQHTALQDLMSQCQLLAFPSIREFGGGVVLEAMALGLVPLVVDYAGPSELVTEHTGFKVPLGSREKIVAEFRKRLIQISDNPSCLWPLAKAGQERCMQLFTWAVKAKQVCEVYRWVRGERSIKPDFPFLEECLQTWAKAPNSPVDRATSPNASSP